MKLSRRTDYAFRLLILLALEPETALSIPDAAARLEISSNHLAKVVQDLTRAELVETVRGRSGGVRLRDGALCTTVGDVVRALEPLELVECLGPEPNLCVLTPACQLRRILQQGRSAFLEALDEYTIGDLVLVRRPAQLRRILG